MTAPSPWVRVLVVVNQDNWQHPTSLARVNTVTASDETSLARVVHLGNIAAAAGHPLPDLAATRTAALLPLPADIINLIDNLTDNDPCEHDRLGGCVTHNHTAAHEPCPHALAQTLLAAWNAIDPANRDEAS